MAGNVDVCCLLLHGFAARMVLQTDVISGLRERGLTVEAVVPNQASEAARDIEQRYSMQVHVAPDYPARESDIVTWLAEQIRSDRFGPDMQLLVRPHPQNVEHVGVDNWMDNLPQIAGPRVSIN